MKRHISIIAAGLLFLLTSSAMAAGSADDSTATERARSNFHRGVQLYNEGSFEAALAEFRKAYQLSPNYRLLYNIAQTLFDLHDYVSSFNALKGYLQGAGNSITTERRAEVNELNQKLKERIAHLDIDCNMNGADIRVDDISVGVSPLSFVVLVNAGPRRITAVKAGYAVAARMVTVVGTETVKVAIHIAAPLQAQGEGRLTSAAGDAATETSPSFIQSEPAQTAPSRTALITTTAVAGGCAVATAIFGILALNAKRDFDRALDATSSTKDNIDSARSKMKNYANLADAFGAATLVSGGVALYFLFSDSGSRKASSTKSSVALAPTVGGMLLYGEW
jgi:tetratricopeptide (TPR) repeat protein